MIMNEQLLYHIAITSIPNIGVITAKKLIAYCGSSEQVFKEKKRVLEKIPGVGEIHSLAINEHKEEALVAAEEELKFIEKEAITPLFYLDEHYPKRLFHCEDGPLVLFMKGKPDLNAQKVVSVVGTRMATEYGRGFCEQIIEELTPHQPLIVSGLAYGIDICAHRAALKCGLPTIGVLAHGLDRVYPSQHTAVAREMQEQGALLTEFKSATIPDRENFPKRNRIVAGMADLTIVVESSKKGGSLITAELANNYNRDVFALPGRLSDSQSEGCNRLIKTHKAALIQSAKDIEYIMNWKTEHKNKSKQTQLFVELTPEQKLITEVLSKSDKAGIDDISLQAKLPMSDTASLLLELEFNGVVRSFPGKLYKLI